jgi:hypothetical protein
MLRCGGYMNFAIAAAHLFMIVAIKPICQALGTPVWIAQMFAEGWTGWARLFLMIAGVAAFVGLLGLYGLSGGGRIRRLPFLRTGLLLTAAIFLFQATDVISNFPVLAQHGITGWRIPMQPMVWIALYALGIGLLYLVGAIGLWKELQPTRHREHTQAVGEV